MTSASNVDEIRTILAEWFSVVEAQGAVTTIQLTHVQPTGPAEIHTWKEGVGPWKDADKLAEFVDTVARRHARGLPGMQQFNLEAAFGGSTRPTRFLPLLQMGALSYGPMSPGASAGSLSTEPPTLIGQTSQAMRLLEQLAQGAFRTNEVTHAQMMEMLKFQGAQLKDALEENVHLRESLYKMMDAWHNLRQDHALKLAEYIRNTKERDRWQTMLPSILNNVLGRDIFPQSTADSSLIEALYQELSPKRRAELVHEVGARNMERGAVIAARFAELDDKAKTQKDELARMLRQSRSLDIESVVAEAAGDMPIVRHSNGAAGPATAAPTEPAPAPEPEDIMLDKPDIDLVVPFRNPAVRREDVLTAVRSMLREAAGTYKFAEVEDGATLRYSASEGAAAGVKASWREGRLSFEGTSGATNGMRGIGVVEAGRVRIQVSLPFAMRLFRSQVEERIKREAEAIMAAQP